MIGTDIDDLIHILSKLPGLGPRSARRVSLHLIKKREQVLPRLIHALQAVNQSIKICNLCYNIDSCQPCSICMHPNRSKQSLCVVSEIADLWAIERSGIFKGTYHVLGGLLCAFDGVGPDQLKIQELKDKILSQNVSEVVLSLSPTVEGQSTLYFIYECLKDMSPLHLSITSLGLGLPLGGELDFLDEGTIATAFQTRKSMQSAT